MSAAGRQGASAWVVVGVAAMLVASAALTLSMRLPAARAPKATEVPTDAAATELAAPVRAALAAARCEVAWLPALGTKSALHVRVPAASGAPEIALDATVERLPDARGPTGDVRARFRARAQTAEGLAAREVEVDGRCDGAAFAEPWTAVFDAIAGGHWSGERSLLPTSGVPGDEAVAASVMRTGATEVRRWRRAVVIDAAEAQEGAEGDLGAGDDADVVAHRLDDRWEVGSAPDGPDRSDDAPGPAAAPELRERGEGRATLWLRRGVGLLRAAVTLQDGRTARVEAVTPGR